MKGIYIGICFAMLLCCASSVYGQGVCPAGLPAGTMCVAGQDTNGAFFLMAVPVNYNHRLVLWNHGYSLAPPAPLSAGDLGLAGGLLPLGFAAAASSYRPDAVGLGGWAVKDGAEDTENLRQRFVEMFGQPDLTFVTGASEGGLITAEIEERFGRDKNGKLNYDGSLPLCGPNAGGRRNWYGGFDLRVVYQYYCQNLPRPSEMQYPLYFGLAPNNTLSLNDVFGRINECTGVLQPPATRTEQQAQSLANILNVTKIPESFLLTDMSFGTFGLAELVQVRTHGLNPLTNLGVQYQGSTDDEALNAGVFRAGPNDAAEDFLDSAYDPTGRIHIPTLTLHTIGDGLVIVENENAYRRTVDEADHEHLLQQNYTNASGHCQFSNSEVLASFQALVGWVESGHKPTREDIANLCKTNTALFGDTCNLNLDFHPKAFRTRVAPREAEPQNEE